MLVSGSKDTTLKIWDMKTRKLMFDLPGHSDEVEKKKNNLIFDKTICRFIPLIGVQTEKRFALVERINCLNYGEIKKVNRFFFSIFFQFIFKIQR